ncbi:MAG: hypothetical protein MUC45_10835 [Actinomycetia bacterium]|jgi:hypothetical protein|nr:hypothetical protein [Actinomycetes bacterium]
MTRTRTTLAVGLAGAVLLTGVVASSAAASGTSTTYLSVAGAWRMTIDPLPNPGGDPPPFVSRIAFAHGGVVTESASKYPPGFVAGSAGIGAWKQHRDRVTFTFERFLYDANGFAAIQRVEGHATVGAKGQTQGGPATATLLAPDGQTVLASFGVQSSGTRLKP